jgi:hypothetical protein
MNVAREYYTAMLVISSEETGRLAVASSVSSMSKSGREKYFKALDKNTKLVKQNNSDKILSVEEAALKLGQALNG